jgi:membrane protein implicated in regulation of membrane protease activity
MDLSASTAWWLAAGVVVAAELATGSFYLLMIALGLAAGALSALAGATVTLQIVVAAVIGGGATALWHFVRSSHPPATPARANRDVNLDIGAHIDVAGWNADRTANVRYRGCDWTAHLQPGAPATAGDHLVVAVEGNWLVLAPAPAPELAATSLATP